METYVPLFSLHEDTGYIYLDKCFYSDLLDGTYNASELECNGDPTLTSCTTGHDTWYPEDFSCRAEDQPCEDRNDATADRCDSFVSPPVCVHAAWPCSIPHFVDGAENHSTPICYGDGYVCTAANASAVYPTCTRDTAFLCSEGCPAGGACSNGVNYTFACGEDGIHCVETYAPLKNPVQAGGLSFLGCSYEQIGEVWNSSESERVVCLAQNNTPCAVGQEIWDPAAMTCTLNNLKPCDDSDPLTADACDDATTPWTCVHTPLECAADGDCDDGNACTADTCRLNNTCSYVVTNASCVPCAVDGDCDDGNDCSADVCSEGVCQHADDDGVTGCGSTSEPCRETVCFGGACVLGWIAGCCIEDVHPCSPAHTHCLASVCVPGLGGTGTCELQAVNNYESCESDDDECTNDVCSEGVCLHDQIGCDENPCADSSCDPLSGCLYLPGNEGELCLSTLNPCEEYRCASGECVYGVKNCDDSNVCTEDHCDSAVPGGCVNTFHVCVDDGNECTNDTCDPVTNCEHPALPNGTECDGGYGECQAGVCVSLAAPCATNADCDDDISCSADACNPTTHSCEHVYRPGCCATSEQCPDDGNVCTNAFCSAKHQCAFAYVPGCCNAFADCEDGNACTEKYCNATTHRCVLAPIPDCCTTNKMCTDEDPCTVDYCELASAANAGASRCVHKRKGGCCAADEDCVDGNLCTLDICNAARHKCVHVAASECACQVQADCAFLDDATACTVGVCLAGTCSPIFACDDSSQRTHDTCNQDGTCSNTPVHRRDAATDFSDPRQACGLVRSAGRAVRGVPILPLLEAKDVLCPDLISGELDANSPVFSTPLSIPAFRTYMEAVGERGQCGAAAMAISAVARVVLPVLGPCNDNDSCTLDYCNADPDGPPCLHAQKNCDDQNRCTDDYCFNGTCVHEAHHCPSDVTPSCMVHECSPLDGLCHAYPAPMEWEPDNEFGYDACFVTECNGTHWVTAPISCDDEFYFTEDTCISPLGVCLHAYKNCDDHDNTTRDGILLDGTCSHEPLPEECLDMPCSRVSVIAGCIRSSVSCDDNNKCTEDLPCDDVLGCVHVAKNCSENITNPCVVGICDPSDGNCVEIAIACDDFDPCTTDSCIPENGTCSNVPKDCDDGDVCTEDGCFHGECVHVPKSCSDGLLCTLDSCVPGVGCQNTAIPCQGERDDSCTVLTCDAETGEVWGVPKDCSDESLCTVDTCDAGTCSHSNPVYVDPECPSPPVNCTIEECMVFNCIDPATGDYNWTFATAATACNISFARYWCDGAGRCVYVPAAAASVGTPTWVWIVVGSVTGGVALAVGILVVVLAATAARARRGGGGRRRVPTQ